MDITLKTWQKPANCCRTRTGASPMRREPQTFAGRLSIEEIAGLMLYSPHQAVPPMPGGPFQGTFDGKTYLESGKEPYAISDQQKEFLEDEHIRHILLTNVESPEISAKWSNELQKRAETLPYGIPINLSLIRGMEQRIPAQSSRAAGSEISKWPEGVGFAACFDPEVAGQFAKDASVNTGHSVSQRHLDRRSTSAPSRDGCALSIR